MSLELQFAEYFATGQHQDVEWQEALLGRIPGSEPAVASGFDYVRIPAHLMPENIQEMLGSGPEFSIVAMRRSNDPLRTVQGTILRLTRRELGLMWDWHISDPSGPTIMLQPTLINVWSPQTSGTRLVYTELTDLQGQDVEVLQYQGIYFLNGREDTIEAARKIRADFLERNPENNDPSIIKPEQILTMAEQGMVEEISQALPAFCPLHLLHVTDGAWLTNIAARRHAERLVDEAETLRRLTADCQNPAWRTYTDGKRSVAHTQLENVLRHGKVIQRCLAYFIQHT